MDKKSFDIAIIGAGPGGYSAAIYAANKKKSALLIEKKDIGGTCLNRGCIPTKSFLHSANLLKKVKDAKKFGIEIRDISFDYKKIMERKDQVVSGLKKSLEKLLLAKKIEIIKKEAKFLSKNELLVGDQIISAEKIIIATGSKSKTLKGVEFDNRYIFDSASILELETLPKKLAIIGGGYIGVEFANFYNLLGVDVTIIEATPGILSFQEKSISNEISRIFKARGIKILTNSLVEKIEKKDGVKISTKDNIIEADISLISLGREANRENLDLEKAGIICDGAAIAINDKMETNIPNIYAIGDVNQKNMLAHVASHQADIAVENAFGGDKTFKEWAIPSTIFTTPEIASVGLSEENAKKMGYEAASVRYPLSSLGKAYTDDNLEGFVKIVFDITTKELLGAHMIGEGASNMISEMTLAIAHELTTDCIKETIHAHPTLPELWLEAAHLAEKNPLHSL